MLPPSARVDSLSKDFADVVALSEVTLLIQPGEVHALLGANGAGKSTLMRCLLGYLRPTSGSVTVLGGDSRDPGIRARIGYLPGDLRLPPRSTAAEILNFHAHVLARAGHPASLREQLVERFAVPVSRRFGTLSKGNRQKVGLVLALMSRPEVLVLDEPTSGLDPLMQAEVLDVIRERRSEGAAVLLSTHILAEAEAIADRVAVLSHGRLVADQSLDALLAGARQTIDVRLETAPPADVLHGAAGLLEVSIVGDRVHAVVSGSLAEVMTRLTPFGVQRIVGQAHELDAMFQQASESTPGGESSS